MYKPLSAHEVFLDLVPPRSTDEVIKAAGIVAAANAQKYPKHGISLQRVGGYVLQHSERGEHNLVIGTAEGAALTSKATHDQLRVGANLNPPGTVRPSVQTPGELTAIVSAFVSDLNNQLNNPAS